MESPPVVAASEIPVAHESRIADHMARHALIVAPLVILACGLLRGVDGAISAAIGLVLVASTSRSPPGSSAGPRERSLTLLQACSARWLHRPLVRADPASCSLCDQLAFIDLPVLVLTIAFTHIALLIWETRYVSLTLAAPGLKPGVDEREPKDKE